MLDDEKTSEKLGPIGLMVNRIMRFEDTLLSIVEVNVDDNIIDHAVVQLRYHNITDMLSLHKAGTTFGIIERDLGKMSLSSQWTFNKAGSS